jgi:hypothetical protein
MDYLLALLVKRFIILEEVDLTLVKVDLEEVVMVE